MDNIYFDHFLILYSVVTFFTNLIYISYSFMKLIQEI
jgi:hypothetical protein